MKFADRRRVLQATRPNIATARVALAPHHTPRPLRLHRLAIVATLRRLDLRGLLRRGQRLLRTIVSGRPTTRAARPSSALADAYRRVLDARAGLARVAADGLAIEKTDRIAQTHQEKRFALASDRETAAVAVLVRAIADRAGLPMVAPPFPGDLSLVPLVVTAAAREGDRVYLLVPAVPGTQGSSDPEEWGASPEQCYRPFVLDLPGVG